MKKKIVAWICIGSISIGSVFLRPKEVRADIWGGDVVVLAQILVQAIQQVHNLVQIVGRARETVNLLEEMNRGVKEVLKLSETAHIPLPNQVYENAKKIDQATEEARRVYGVLSEKSPQYTKTHYRSGVEGLYLSQDAFDYSTFLDEQGKKVKSASIIASQATATRLTAQTLGVLLHAISHSNRLQAKELEINSTKRIEDASKEDANYESFIKTHEAVETEFKSGFSPLNSFKKE